MKSIEPSIIVNGISRSTLNSNGNVIHPTEDGIKNFWEWFGDSKVVDIDGRPLVVYHGSSTSFDVFRPSKSVGNQGETDQIEGMYFTDNREGASFFSLIDHPKYLKEFLFRYFFLYFVLSLRYLFCQTFCFLERLARSERIQTNGFL